MGQEDKESRRQLLLNSKELQVLAELLDLRRKQLVSVRCTDYDKTPNWDVKQAHLNGMTEAVEWVLDLLTFEGPK